MERVNTGGLTEINYPKGWKPSQMTEEEKESLDNAWEKVRIRKAKERKRNIWRGIILLIIFVGTYFLLRGYI